MPTQNPTVISASLDDSKLRKSITDLVAFVDAQTKAMATSFDNSVSKMESATKRIGDALKGIKQPDSKTNNTKSESQAVKQVVDSYDALAKAKEKAMNTSAKDATVDFIYAYRERVESLKKELESLEKINLATLKNKFSELSEPIRILEREVSKLEAKLKKVPETDMSKRIGISYQIEAYKKQIDELTQKRRDFFRSFYDSSTATPFNSTTRQIADIRSKIKEANDLINQMALSLSNAESEEKKLAVGAEKIATEYAKITSRTDTKKAFTQAVLMDDSTIESATAKAERLRNIMKEVYNTPFASVKQYKDLQMALSGVEQKIRELRSGKTGDIATDETTRVKKEAEAIKRSIDEQISKEKERKEAIIQTGNAAQEQSRKIIEMMHWQLGKADETPILGVKQLSDEIIKMRRAYFEMSESEKESPIGKALKQDIEKANAALEAVQKYNRALMMQTGNVGDTVTLDKLRKTLKGLMFDYASLSQEETKSARGTALIDKIHKTESAINELQKRLARPTSLVNALKLPEDTLDRISEKIRQLQLYKGGLKITDPKQAAEIQQVDQEINRLGKDLNKYMASAKQTMQENNALSRSWNYMKNRLAFYFTVGASTQFVKNLIDIRSQYEMTERSLGILINSAERGTQIFNQLSDMALVSPYTLIELSNAAKQLVAYDVAAKDVVDTTRRLADMAAAVGIPMERLTYALGQIKAYGYLNSRDARMFANAGIPLVKQLSEYYTQLEGRMVSIGDVYSRMKKKTIEYNDVMSVINKMTDEGGKFFDFQAKMAETLKVQLANLTLAWNNMLNSIGSSNQGILVGGVKLLKEFFLQWKNIERAISSLAIGFTIFKTLQIAALALAKNVSIIRTNLVATNEQLSYSGVLGGKLTKTINGIGGALKGLFTAQNGIFLVIFAIVDMVMKVNQANEAIGELNKSIRDGAKETKNSLDEMLGSYSKLGDYTLTTDQKTGRVSSATYTGSQDPDEMQKTWTAIREEIETSTAYGKIFMGQLVTETDLSERLSKAFEITAKLRDVHGALQDISSDSIKVGQDMSAWWNLWWADKGLIEGLKYYNEYLTSVENKDLLIFDWKSIGESTQETVDRIQKELFDKIKENADETAKSISDAFKNLKFDPQQMREGFEEISNKIFEGKGLDPKTELQGRIELEKAFIKQRKQMYIDAANEQARLGNQAQAEQIRASYNTWIKAFGQNQVLVNGFYDWLKSHRASELQSMFGNMTQEEINHINWSKPKWQNWAKENAQAFSKQMGVSFDDLWRWVQDANTWRIHIGVVLDTTQIQKSVFETLSNADTKANEAYQHIKRLNDEITRLQGKSNRTKEENEKLTKAINERNVAQADYNKAVAEGGKSAKESSDANKSAAAARKAHAAATRAQRQAESELQKALKEELSIVDKIRSTYKDLRKAGVGTTSAIALATGGYEKSVKAINATLAKFGLERFNPSKFAGIENPHELLTMFENQLNKLIASGKAKPAEIVELETKINEMKIDVKKFDIEKITKGLNSELDKLKDEYELSVELDANPELGAALLDMFGIDESTLPKSIDKYMDKVQSEFDSYIQKMNKANSSSISLIDIFSTTNDQFKKWAESSGFSDDYIKELTQMRNNAKGVVDKWIRDTIKSTQDLEYKLADINGKIAIEQKKLDNLRLLHQQETNEKQRHLLELMIRDQENAIDKLKQDILSTLPTYQRLFNSVVEHSARMTRQLAQNYKQMLELAIKNGKNSNGKYEVKDPISGQTAELTEKEMNAQLGKVNGKLRETQTSFDKIKEALKEGEDELVDWVKAVELIADEAHKIADGISEMANIADALGADEDVTEVINDIAASIDGLSTAAQGAAQIANGDIIGGTVNVVKGLWTTVSSWFDNSDKRITKKVKNSERAVKDLENAYKRLEYAVEHSMGAAETQARRAAIANKQLQLVELQRQLELEKSRKKKNQDIDRIKELEGSVIDAENDLKNLKDDVMNTLLGSDIKSAAEEFVDTWVQAWREGETTLDAIEEKMDDMIFNLIKKAATSKIVGNLLQPLYDMVDQYTSAGSEGGVELTANELKALAVLSDKLGIDINNALGVFYGNLENLDIVSKNIKGNELSALQQGIQGITEDTAGALEAITNAISQQVYLHSDLLMQIRDAVVAMNGDIQLSTQAQMLLQLQNSYILMQSMHSMMNGWTIPSGAGIRVELIN